MARINRVFLRGAVLKPPQVAKNGDQFIYARVYVTVVRSGLGVADRDDLVCDVPLIMTRDTACIREIETWGVNDIVSIKGVFASRRIKKHQDPDPRRHHVYQPDLLRKDLPS